MLKGALFAPFYESKKALQEMTASQNSRDALAIVLAAGEGTRMKSARPKVLHEVAGRTMLAHVLSAVADADARSVAVVLGPGRDDVRAEASAWHPEVRFFVQEERRGTAHAVLAAREAIEEGFDDVLVLFADTPLVTGETLLELRAALFDGAAVAALGFEAKNPFGYGRLLLDEVGGLVAIREEKDASPEERRVTLCNAGLMAIDGRHALALLDQIDCVNAKNEFYLTDVVAKAREAGMKTRAVLGAEVEALGVNDRAQLAQAEADRANSPAAQGDGGRRDADRAGNGFPFRRRRHRPRRADRAACGAWRGRRDRRRRRHPRLFTP